MRVGLIQMTSSDDPSENLLTVSTMIKDAAAGGADFVLTPEVTNCLSASRRRQEEVLVAEAEDQTLAMLRGEAALRKVWLLIGSLALKADDDPRLLLQIFCNNMVGPTFF